MNSMNFERGQEPYKTMNMGKMNICPFLKNFGIKDFKVIDYYTVQINEDLDLTNGKFVKFKNDFFEKFKTACIIKLVKGNFWCDKNNLESLEGCPKKVEGSFLCTNNPLKSLKDLPEIKGNLWI